jgi:hypothetical protein
MNATLSRRGLIGATAVSPLLLAASAPAVSAATVPSSPRLFFTPAALASALALKKSGVLAAAWTNLDNAAAAAQRTAIGYFSSTDPERWWERYDGWSMANLGAAYLLGGNIAYRNTAIQIATMAAAYPVWGIESLNGGDLQAADLLFGMSMVVDWFASAMSASTLATLLAALRTRGAQMASYATGVGGPAAYWSNLWMMNHLWDNTLGLLAAGLALQPYDTVNSAKFISVATNSLAIAFAALPTDGSTQESPAYWDYTCESVLKYHHLATQVLGLKLTGPWLANAASYRGAMSLPLSTISPGQSMVNQADGSLKPWFGPEYQRALAPPFRARPG